jgi:hypothetical protein
MTQTTDLDRQLSDWLHEGPNRAPDQPIAAATSFARAHPRRPDPLRILRSDPMADRRRRAFGLQPGLVFAMLALVAAIVAAGVIGSQLENRPVVVPPSDRPAPSSAASPAPSASASPTTTEQPAPFAHVDLASSCCPGNPPSVDVVDLSGLVVSASSALPLESDSVDGIIVKDDKANSLRITWLGSPCNTVHRLSVDATATKILLERPGCFGDAMPRFLSLTLTFSRPVVASDVAASIVEGRGAGGALPNWTADGPDTSGNVFHMAIYDASGLVASAESSSQGGGGTTLPTDQGRLENVTPTSIKVTWSRSACASEERLMIDAGLTTLTLIGGDCGTGLGGLDREVTLEFSRPVAAAGLTLDVHTASPGPS